MVTEIVILRWRDAGLHGQGTKWEEDLDSVGLVTLISAGILVKEDEDSLTLCMDWMSEEKSWRSLASYPKSGIKIIKRIKIPKAIYGNRNRENTRNRSENPE